MTTDDSSNALALLIRRCFGDDDEFDTLQPWRAAADAVIAAGWTPPTEPTP